MYDSDPKEMEPPALIILDASTLKSISLRGPDADVLRALQAAKVEQVATPWIAMEEIAAQQVLRYQQKHDSAIEAVNDLRKATPWADIAHPRKFQDEHVRKHWRDRYAEVAEVIETSASVYQEAMYRETNLLAPCKTVNSGRNKTGARDAAIWLTAVEYARTHPTETVYFVSGNTEDFGDGTSFPSPMDKDLIGLEGRFFLFTSLDGVLTRFATEVEARVEDVQGLLDNATTRRTVLKASWDGRQRHRVFAGSRLDENFGELLGVAHAPWAPHAIAFDKIVKLNAREIDGHKWFTASVRWLVVEDARVRRGSDGRIGYAWETHLLLSPTASEGLTVLGSKRPEPIRPEDLPNLPVVDQNAAEELIASGVEMLKTPQFRRFLDNLRLQETDLSPVEAALRSLNSSPREDALRLLMESLRDLPPASPDAGP
ncbi:PIN domain-containing protein [Streptomyces parvus]|uniref:PIN domain-containing protein n=1 Tax=Streptomyces parvus TaxID=66428 RepID=UPI0034081ABC